MSNAILPSAALDRRASPVMPLFTGGGELGSAWPRPRCPGGGGESPSALLISPLRTHLSPPRYSISEVSGMPACELRGYPLDSSQLLKSPCALAYTSSQ